MRLLAMVGKGFLFLATLAFLTGISLFVVGGFLATWPVLRLTPQNARVRALSNLTVAVMELVRAWSASTNSRLKPPNGASSHEPHSE